MARPAQAESAGEFTAVVATSQFSRAEAPALAPTTGAGQAVLFTTRALSTTSTPRHASRDPGQPEVHTSVTTVTAHERVAIPAAGIPE